MRVLLSSHGAGPYGAERMILSLAQGLSRRGHEVILEFPHEGPSVETARQLHGIEVLLSHRPRLPRTLSEGLRFFLGIPSSIRALRKVTRQVAPELVWVNSLFNPWAALGARSAGVPVIWHLHETNPSPPLGVLAPGVMGPTVDQVVSVSAYVARTLSIYPWLARKVRILGNPLLQPLEPVADEPHGPFTVGFVGQFEPRKRAPDLARALALLPEARGIFVGDGKARRALEGAIHANGVGGRTQLTGFSEDAPQEFSRFHCLAIPSVREPFGLVALEAMARGIPVVAARSGALPEVLGDAALFFRPGDPRALAEKLTALQASPSLRQALREKGLNRVSGFGMEGWLDGVEEIMAGSIKEGRSR